MKAKGFAALWAMGAALAACSGGSGGGGFVDPRVTVSAPAEGAVVADLLIPVDVLAADAAPGSARVFLDGADATARLTRTPEGSGVRVTGVLAALDGGDHALRVEVDRGGVPASVSRSFRTSPPPFVAPDAAIAGKGEPGETVWVVGTVKAVTYDVNYARCPSEIPNCATGPACPGDKDNCPAPHRYVILDIENRPGFSECQNEWGLGVRLTGAQAEEERIPLPYPGDRVAARGVVARQGGFYCSVLVLGNPEERFILSGAEIGVLETARPPRADLGEDCANDMECRDDLVCDARGRVCRRQVPALWPEGDPDGNRNLNGACDDDFDCPLGQVCRDGYAILPPPPASDCVRPRDEATLRACVYGAYYNDANDPGRRLCQVPDRAAPAETICPSGYATVDDVAGGRFVPGKEVCLLGTVDFTFFVAGDRDHHVQLFPDPDVSTVYPLGRTGGLVGIVSFAGVPTEVVPPYKDPANPQGPLSPVFDGATARFLGTVQYDHNHDWFEHHPYKWFEIVDDGKRGATPADAP